MRPKSVLLPMLVVLGLLMATTAAGAAPQPQPGPPDMQRVFVAFDRQPGPIEEAMVRGMGGNIRYNYSLVPAVAASVPQAAIPGLRRNPRVTGVEPVIAVQAMQIVDEWSNSWGVSRIGTRTVHTDYGNTGAGIKVAIIDTGIAAHPDLPRPVKGYDFVEDDAVPDDDNGHGTHVAGILAAAAGNGGVIGVGPQIQLYVYKVLGADGSGSSDDLIAAIQQAVADGVQITSHSYGSFTDPGPTVKAAFDRAYAAGVLHVAAAGNGGNMRGTGDSVAYPARWSSVIAVAATDISDVRASFSATGRAVELAAPGVAIRSTAREGGYADHDGTSVAAPHVSGAAALVMGSGVSGASNVRNRLAETATDLGDDGRDNQYGYGLVNVAEAAASGTPANAAPVTVADSYGMTQGTLLSVAAANGVLKNDADANMTH